MVIIIWNRYSLSLSLCFSLFLCPYSRVIRTCLGHTSSLCSQGFWINISFHRCYRFYGWQRSSDWPNRWVEVEQNREGCDNMFYSNDFWGVRNESEMKNDRNLLKNHIDLSPLWLCSLFLFFWFHLILGTRHPILEPVDCLPLLASLFNTSYLTWITLPPFQLALTLICVD